MPHFETRRLQGRDILALAPYGSAGQCCVYIWRHCLGSVELENLLRQTSPGAALPYGEDDAPRSEKRRTERLSTLLLAKRLFGQTAFVTHAPDGSPLLSGVKDAPHISVSHSGGAYALSVAPVRHGIDIERHSPTAFRLRGKFLSKEEEALLAQTNLPPEAAATLFWSAKEAIYKCAGGEAQTVTDVLLTTTRAGEITAFIPAAGTYYAVETGDGEGGVITVCQRLL